MTHKLNSQSWSLTFMMGAMLFDALVPCNAQPEVQAIPNAQASILDIKNKLEVGDVVFIRIPALPFKKVASTTGSWTNHVGIVTDISGEEPVIAESRFPYSGKTTWSRFVGRSEAGRVAVSRLAIPLDAKQRIK